MWMARRGRRGSLALVALRQKQLLNRVVEAYGSESVGGFNILGVVQRFLWTKAQHSSANGDDTYGCRNPFEGVVVGTFPTFRLRVKTYDQLGLDEGGVLHCHPLGGVDVEF
jgi:hypothetical protein